MATPTRQPLMAGNWKENLNHLEAIALVQKLAFSLTDDDLDAVEVAVLPPFTDIRSVQTMVDGDKLRIRYGAQDVSQHDAGAHTGEISGAMLAKLYASDVADGVRILYGGSVKASNIGPIMEQPDVDGALVGGASLEADEFAVICRYRDHPPR